MKPKVLVYTFNAWRRVAHQVTAQLDNDKIVAKKYLRNNRRDIDNLCQLVSTSGFSHILGLGNFNRRAKRIRIESRFINQYGLQILAKSPELRPVSWKWPECELTYHTTKTSNGPCNRSGYLLSSTIQQHQLSTKLAFLHIPGKFNKSLAIQYINTEVNNT